MIEYKVWLLNQVEEGYQLREDRVVPVGWVGEIVIWENMGVMFPSVQLKVEDVGAGLADYRHKAGAVVVLRVGNRVEDFWDFALVRHDLAGMENMKRPGTQFLVLKGFDVIGSWLSKARSRGYGEKGASVVARKVVEDVLSEYLRLGSGVRLVWDVEDTVDRESYVQAGVSSTSFLYYLRDKGLVSGKRDICCWFDRRGRELRFNFVSLRKLMRDDVKFRMRYEVDGEVIERAVENGGYVEDGVLCVLSFKVISLSAVLGWLGAVGKLVEFDEKRLKVVVRNYDYLSNFNGRVKDNLWLSVLKEGQDRFYRGVDEGYVVRNLFRRFLVVTIVGCRELRLGDKVRVMIPHGYQGGDMYEVVSGDWVVVGIVHLISNRGRQYLQKVLLGSPALKSEKKEVW